ncbi:MAG: RnfABCDGE type electron transport complex subunit D [Spirochaetaceae bacterium]|nr:RnfABCDGE type electron transport complex subunit D [Spirochaetaceae bacterium]
MSAPSDINEIYLSSSPHFSSKRSTTFVMLCVVIALLPLCVNGVVLFGIPALVTILVSVVSCVGFEFIFQKLTKQTVRITDLSAVVTGLMLALVLPPTVPVWMIVLGGLFAIIVAKGFFGGIGANVFNPALTGRAFLFTSFPVAMSTWTLPIDGVTGATVLSEIKGGVFFADSELYLQFFLGNRAGCIGETSILLILIAFVFLLVTKIIDWRAPISMVATVVFFTWVTGGDPLMAILSGGLMFGAVFMVTDYATTPVTKGGRVVFGAGCGLITFLIRQFGGYPEGVMFSILIMNALTPFLNKIISVKYGYRKQYNGGKTK